MCAIAVAQAASLCAIAVAQAASLCASRYQSTGVIPIANSDKLAACPTEINAMCGRFTVTVSAKELQEAFPLFDLLSYTPRFNVAPTQQILAVRREDDKPKPQGVFLRWGLVPSWADDLSIGSRMINARADGIDKKPSFRAAFKKRRCLILTDGFYEWRKGAKPKDPKQPFHIHFKDRRPFAFAGLWETWKKGEEPVETCTIITTDANEAIAALHDRMPVILPPRDFARWLDPAPGDPAALLEMLRPYPAPDEIETTPVSTHVNNARHEDPDCLSVVNP